MKTRAYYWCTPYRGSGEECGENNTIVTYPASGDGGYVPVIILNGQDG